MTICGAKNDVRHWETQELKPVIDDSLVLYLTPDYDGNYNDISGKGNTVINFNSAPVPVDSKGLFGANMLLNGKDSYLKALNSNSLNSLSTGMTISIWVNKQSHAPIYGGIIGRRYGASFDDLFYLLYSKPANGYKYVFGIKGLPGVTGRASTNDLNKWVNVTGVFNGSTIQLYLNGVLEGSVAATGKILQDTTDIYIGCGDNGTGGLGEFSNIKVGTVLIYNRGLSQSEVLTNYRNSPYNYLPKSID